MRIELTVRDLARVGLAATADPMAELVSSLQLLQRRDGGAAAFTRWRHRVWQALPESAHVLLWLCRPDAPVPEFLVPTAGRCELEPGLAAVAKTDPARLKAQLRHAPANRDLPAWAAGLAAGDGAGLPKLVQAMRDYFELALAPGWEVARGQVEADLGMRSQLMLRGGVDAVLGSLRPLVRWLAPALEADGLVVGEWCARGGGLVLAPTCFRANPAIIPVGGGAARLLYPAVRHLAPAGASGRASRRSAHALADLLGPTRAAALAILVVGCSTSELAARLGVSASAISKHTTVLREAGLITTHRERNTVLHSLTPLGSALLDT